MEYFGLIAFVLMMTYSSYPSKVKKLEKQLLAIKRNEKGEIINTNFSRKV